MTRSLSAACLQVHTTARGGTAGTSLPVPAGSHNFHTCAVLQKQLGEKLPERWPRFNKIVYPPRGEGEPIRPAVSKPLSINMHVYTLICIAHCTLIIHMGEQFFSCDSRKVFTGIDYLK